MRPVILALVLLAICSSFARAQNYRLELHSDEALSSCELAIPGPGIAKVYMVVTGSPGYFGAVQFKAPKPACMTNSVWVADVWDPQVNAGGYTQATGGTNGVDVVVGCLSLPRYLGSIWYNVTGPVSSCCAYAPQPGQRDGPATIINAVIWSDCPLKPTSTIFEGAIQGKGLMINADQSCRCDIPLPVQESTWGSVKALYR
ncbi:MAG TPA: hypothetical protein VJS69_13815 [Candidatus Krumholzibacteria bacterium]|nr:hypothetical protein [Candidatus Krumholzibacteria bacterium]